MMFYAMQESITLFIANEHFEQNCRSMATTFVMVLDWTLGALFTFLYPVAATSIGTTYAMLPFPIATALCTIYLAIALPETKQRAIDEICREWEVRAGIRSPNQDHAYDDNQR